VEASLSVGSFLQDARFAARLLRRSGGITTVAVLTLALGIGANTAFFSVVKAVLLNPLPYDNSSQLVTISETAPGTPNSANADYTTVVELRRSSRSLTGISAFRDGPGILLENGAAEMLRGLSVDYNFFDTLGVQIELGRNFAPADQRQDRRLTLILTHELWVQRFGANPRVLGRVLRLSGFDVTVIGVLPRNFQPLLKATSEIPPQMYYPLPCDPATPSPSCQSVRVIARLAPGVRHNEASLAANALFQSGARHNPTAHFSGARLNLKPLEAVILGASSAVLWIVWAAAGFVLLIACANISNLLLAHATARQREISLRIVLGANRGRIASQLLTESMLLAAGGGGLGIFFAMAGTRALALFVPTQIPRAEAAQVDGAVLLYTLVATVAAGFLFGLAPVWRGFRSGLNQQIGGAARAGYLRNTVAIAEIGLAFVLTVGAGLMVQTFANLMRQAPGYDAHNVLTLSTSVSGRRYAKNRVGYYRDSLERLRRIPGIESAAFSSLIPMDYTVEAPFFRDDRPTPNNTRAPLVDRYSVSTDYFRVLRIPVLSGRVFNAEDEETAPKVAVINESCARAEFLGEDPIGKHVRLGEEPTAPWMTVVGVVGDVRQDGIDHPADMQVYSPLDQGAIIGFYRLVARTAGDPMRLDKPVRAVFAGIDAESPVYHIKPLQDYLAGRLADRRFALALLVLFGILALLLAGVGVYGIMSYSVRLRTREIGIRMSLGADPMNTVCLVLRGSINMAAAGIALGLVGAFTLMRTLSTLLFQVQATDPMTLAGVAVLLLLITVTAATIPACRAATVDPISVLRQE